MRPRRFRCCGLRQSEVEDLDQPVLGEEQVLGFQVAMSNALRMRRRQAVGVPGCLESRALMRRSNSKHALDNVSKSSRRPPDTGHEAPGAADRARPKILIVRIGDDTGG